MYTSMCIKNDVCEVSSCRVCVFLALAAAAAPSSRFTLLLQTAIFFFLHPLARSCLRRMKREMMYFSETESRHVFSSELVKRLYDYLTMESFWPCVMLSASSSLLLPKQKELEEV